MPSSRQISKVLPFCSGFVPHRTVLRICAAQCKGFELCSAKDLLLHLIPYFSGFQRWQFQQWEAIWGGKNEKVKPIIVINIMKNPGRR